MIKNYLKIAWRNMAANKLFTSLNIAGLGIGMCVCITLFACISYELSFDRTYKNSKHIYRVNMQTTEQYNYQVWAQLPFALLTISSHAIKAAVANPVRSLRSE